MANKYANLTADDFLAAIVAALPPGKAFAVWAGSVKEKFWTGVANLVAKVHDDIIALIDIELDPRATVNLLDRWEECWGLPDSCITDPGDIVNRRRLLVSKIADPGGLTKARYIQLAASLGYTVTIDEIAPFYWRMNVPISVEVTTMTCADPCDSELRSWGDEILECVINLRNRATCIVYFVYTGVI